MKTKNKEILATTAFSVLLILVFSVGFYLLSEFIALNITRLVESSLEEIVDQHVHNVVVKIADDMDSVTMLATAIATFGSVENVSDEYISSYNATTRFKSVVVIDTKGQGRFASGDVLDLSEREYFQRSLNGETVVFGPMKSKKDENMVIVISVPIMHDGAILGVLACSYMQSLLDSTLVNSFEGSGYSYLFDVYGEIIATVASESEKSTSSGSVGDSLIDILGNATIHYHGGLARIQETWKRAED